MGRGNLSGGGGSPTRGIQIKAVGVGSQRNRGGGVGKGTEEQQIKGSSGSEVRGEGWREYLKDKM